MTKSKRSFATKLFLSFLATNILIIAVIAILVGLNMRAGFSRYLLDVELQRFDNLVTQLADHHQSHGNWIHLKSAPKNWHDLVRQSMGGPARPRPPHPLPNDRRFGPPLRPAPDPLRLGDRLSLIGPEGNVIAGRMLLEGITEQRPIFASEQKEQGKPVAYLVLSAPIGHTAARDNAFLFDQFRILFFASLIAVALSALAAFLLARGALRPLHALMTGTRQMAKGDYGARMQEDRSDEFGQLIAHFNAMVSSLQDAEKAERQWLSDASHELKTPLAILRGRIEGIQDGIYQPTDSLMAEMHQTVERLTMLVSDLNLLAHAREGQLLIHPSQENLSDLVRDALDHAESRLQEKGLTVDTTLPQLALIDCDQVRIRQLLDNLIENSRRYSDGPGKVRISIPLPPENKPNLVLIIEDSAPCPSEESLPHLFDRFYRTDPSRDRRSGGSGLGLAICRAIVHAHGGSIEATPSGLGGLKVTISLPKRQKTIKSKGYVSPKAQNNKA